MLARPAGFGQKRTAKVRKFAEITLILVRELDRTSTAPLLSTQIRVATVWALFSTVQDAANFSYVPQGNLIQRKLGKVYD